MEYRIACLNLMAAALLSPAFAGATFGTLHKQVIGTFCKCLTLRAPEIVQAAHKGLSEIIKVHTVPRDLLQSSLRDVFSKLSDYRKLSVPLLQGFHRLLELLAPSFNIALGQVLLGHLQKWKDPANVKIWKSGQEVAIAAAIINTFHLLPKEAGLLLDDLLDVSLTLEEQLPRELSSPYREPLVRFLSCYAAEANHRFMTLCIAQFSSPAAVGANDGACIPPSASSVSATSSTAATPPSTSNTVATMIHPSACRSYQLVIKHARAEALRKHLAASSAEWIPRLIRKRGAVELRFLALRLIHTLIASEPEWPVNNTPLHHTLMSMWHSKGRKKRLMSLESSPPVHLMGETRLLTKCLLAYYKANPTQVEILLELASIFGVRTVSDYQFLRDYYASDVVVTTASESWPLKKMLLQHFILTYNTKPAAGGQPEQSITTDHRVQLLRHLILPLLTSIFAQGSECIAAVIDQQLVADLVLRVLDKPDATAAQAAAAAAAAAAAMAAATANATPGSPVPVIPPPPPSHLEALNVELIQLATMLVQHLPQMLSSHLKELVKFTWHHLSSDDTTSKHYAFVLVSRFIVAYDTPEPVVLQVFVSLLRAHQQEVKSLVRKALDILTPVLHHRLRNPDARILTWVKYTKKVIVEEGHILSQLFHIFQLIVAHADLFYPFREHFVHQIASALPRMPNQGSESRKLMVDLMEVLINWERRRIREATSLPTTASTTTPATSTATTTTATTTTTTTSTPAATTTTASSASSDTGVDTDTGNDASASSTASRKRPRSGSIDESLQQTAKVQRTGASTSVADGTAAAAAATAAPQSTPVDSDRPPFVPSLSILEMVVSLLTRIASTLGADSRESPALSHRALALLKQALSIWPQVVVKFAFFEKLLLVEQAHVVCTGLQILHVIVDHQLQAFVAENVAAMQHTLPLCLRSDNIKVTSAACKLIERIIKGFPPASATGAVANFYATLTDAVTTGLNIHTQSGAAPTNLATLSSTTAVPATAASSAAAGVGSSAPGAPGTTAGGSAALAATISDRPTVTGVLMLLELFANDTPSKIDRHIPALVKLLQKLVKEYSATAPSASATSSATSATSATAAAAAAASAADAQRAKKPDGTIAPMATSGSTPTLGSSNTSATATSTSTGSTSASSLTTSAAAGGARASGELSSANPLVQMIALCLRLINMRIAWIGDSKKALLSTMQMVIERSRDIELLELLTGILHTWIVPRRSSDSEDLRDDEDDDEDEDSEEKERERERERQATQIPIVAKEKIVLLLKMTRFEALNQPALQSAFLELVYHMYNDASASRSDITQLEPAFMMGVRSSNVATRTKFFEILHRSIIKSLPQRLNYLLAVQNWDSLANYFWIKQALDLLLAVVVGKDNVRLAPKAVQLPRLPSFPIANHPRVEWRQQQQQQKPQPPPQPQQPSGSSLATAPLTPLAVLLHDHKRFLQEVRKARVADLIVPLRELVHADTEVPYRLWVSLFPLLWRCLAREEQQKLLNPIAVLLSKDYHSNQFYVRPNVVQALLEGLGRVSLSTPSIRLRVSAELVKYLGKTYNSWHVALHLLEQQINPTAVQQDERLYNSLAELYKLLGEDDLYYGLWLRRASMEESRIALSLSQMGMWQRAQEMYFLAMTNGMKQVCQTERVCRCRCRCSKSLG